MLQVADKQYEVFPWNDIFDTGIDTVDTQHKCLVFLLNKLAVSLANLSDPLELDEVFDELASYADYHFKTEEEVWKPYLEGDERLAAHKRTHESFLPEVTKIKEAGDPDQLEETLETILKFLNEWLATHILDDDKRLALIVHGVDSGLTLEEAKAKSDEEMNGSLKVVIETVLSLNQAHSERTLELMKEKAELSRVEETLKAMLESSEEELRQES